ncbi:MAG: hypothetical protein V4560_09715 [Bacteroidota bacterium]|jgi:hypothetical protein
MLRRDYMLNEARKLAELIAKLLGLKAEGNYTEYSQLLNDTLQKEYDADAETLVALSEEDFNAKIATADYSTEKLNALSQLLYMLAQPFKADEETKTLLNKVLAIFDLLEQKHAYQSFENLDKQKIIYQYFKNNE